MVTSLIFSAFSPSTLKANIKPNSFTFSPDEKPVKDDGKKKIVKRDDTTKTAINPLILALSSDEHDHQDEGKKKNERPGNRVANRSF